MDNGEECIKSISNLCYLCFITETIIECISCVCSPVYSCITLCCESNKKSNSLECKEQLIKKEHVYIYPPESVNIDKNRILECREILGEEICDLINKGSHNNKVVESLKQQPHYILETVFEKMKWGCGDERLSYLKERVGYTTEV